MSNDVIKQVGEGHFEFHCPGCDETHMVTERWSWNGSKVAPTFTPSLLIRTGHHAPGHKPDGDCWCTYAKKNPENAGFYNCYVCHSFITDGKIQFLGDCTHKLAGQTVNLPELSEEQKQ